jgi:hypothetical protein
MTRNSRIIYWLPRALCIVAILFVSMFALDSFQPGLSIWEQLQDFAMHLIPSFILTIFLVIAWKWELIGGILFLLIGLGLSPIIYMHNFRMNGSVWMSLGVLGMITVPFIIVGILFILGGNSKKKQGRKKEKLTL